MRVTFLLPLLGHPRIHKRIRALEEAGAQVRVLAFERRVPFKSAELPAYESLGALKDGQYFKRVGPYLGAIRRVRAAAAQSDVLYCFSADLLSLGLLAVKGMKRRPRLACEVADIRGVLVGEGRAAKAARAVEARVIRQADLLVVTSEAFVRGYYEGVQGLSGLPSFVLENKVDAGVLEAPTPPGEDWDGVLRIVFSGLMCCTRSWDVLDRLAREGGDRVHVRLHGILQAGLERLEQEVSDRPNVDYLGPFEAPRELPEVFGPADLVWIAHAYGEANQAWSRANRFYQAGYYLKPMVAQQGTEDARVVEAEGFGPVVDLHQPSEAVERLLAVGADDLIAWRKAVAAAPPELFALSDDHSRLLQRLSPRGTGRKPPPSAPC